MAPDHIDDILNLGKEDMFNQNFEPEEKTEETEELPSNGYQEEKLQRPMDLTFQAYRRAGKAFRDVNAAKKAYERFTPFLQRLGIKQKDLETRGQVTMDVEQWLRKSGLPAERIRMIMKEIHGKREDDFKEEDFVYRRLTAGEAYRGNTLKSNETVIYLRDRIEVPFETLKGMGFKWGIINEFHDEDAMLWEYWLKLVRDR